MADFLLSNQAYYQSLCQVLVGAPFNTASWTAADWERFTRLARSEGVAPLLYVGWKRAGFPTGLPASEQLQLRQAYLQSAGRNTLYLNELAKIRALFDRQGIECQPLKGAALAGKLYPDPATRPMSDLDLLVRPTQLRPALAALRSLGYSLENFTYHAVLWGHAPAAPPVELHWSLPYPEQQRRQPPEPWFWAQAAQQPFAALLLHAIVHLQVQNRGQGRLLNYLDILYLAQSLGGFSDWTGLQAQAQEFGWEEAYTAALQATAQRFPYHFPFTALPIPAEDEPTPTSSPSNLSSRDRYTAAAWQHLDTRTRLQAAFSLLFPGRGYILWRFHPRPAWLWPLWYPVRWRKLIQERARLAASI